jgi:hypothetical protein
MAGVAVLTMSGPRDQQRAAQPSRGPLVYLRDQPLRLPNLDRKTLLEFARLVDSLLIVVAGDDVRRTQDVALVVDCKHGISQACPSHPRRSREQACSIAALGCGFWDT